MERSRSHPRTLPFERPPSRLARAGRTALVALMIGGLLLTGRALWVAAVPVGDTALPAQLRYLGGALASGAGEDMQQLFPEGYFFTHVLTGLAAAQSAAPGDAAALDRARAALSALDSPRGREPFPADARPAHGVFWAGWSLALAVEVSRISGVARDREDVVRRAAPILDALDADADGFLESYPGQVWPVDTVVAVSALARAAVPGASEAVAGWTARTKPLRDPATGLLPHRIGADGTVAEGPRGSSQALLLAFAPDIDPARAAEDYHRFVETFVVRRLGFVGVLEYPPGTAGEGDIDSGPLVFGVSASASAVALAAARRQGDDRLAASLDAEAELLGAAVQWRGERRYAFGLLPVADAFLAWARAHRAAAPAAAPSPTPAPLWQLWALLPVLPVALSLLSVRGSRARPVPPPVPQPARPRDAVGPRRRA